MTDILATEVVAIVAVSLIESSGMEIKIFCTFVHILGAHILYLPTSFYPWCCGWAVVILRKVVLNNVSCSIVHLCRICLWRVVIVVQLSFSTFILDTGRKGTILLERLPVNLLPAYCQYY